MKIKMKRGTSVVFLILLSMSHLGCIRDSAQAVEEWREDIGVLIEKIEQYHPLPWARISRESFMKSAEEIKANLRDWNRERIILEVMKLVASLRDGHTQVLLNNQEHFNLWFPVRFEKFRDGIFITGADGDNAGLLGAKVLRMGNLDDESAYSRIGTIIAADSDHGLARLVTNYLSNAVILETLGIIESQKLLPLEVRLLDGLEKKVSLESAEWRNQFNLFYNKRWVPTHNESRTVFDDKSDALPLYLSGIFPSRVPYWFEYVPADRLIYFQFNNVANWSGEPFRLFTERLFKTYDEHISEIDKFVIDVRFNSGGNGYLLPPFIREFILRRDSLSRGKLYIITGIHTFSAASNFIGQMLKNSSAITVGDIAAGPLNWCSDTIAFALPNSNLMVNLSTMFWQEGHATDSRGYYPPDYYIPATFKDYISGSDPVLEAIKNNQATSLKDILFNEGADKFRAEYQRREKANGPAEVWFPYTSFDLILYTVLTLAQAGKMDEAWEISKLNTVLYPEKVRAWYFLADMNENRGEFKEALKCYEKLFSIEPHIPEARSAYHSLLLREAFSEQGINAVARVFEDLKKRYPSQINEGFLNNLGYRLLREKRSEDAIEIFKLNIELHPLYANGYDSLGEAYMNAGENELAIQNYEKSLELDPGNDNARQMLEQLRKK